MNKNYQLLLDTGWNIQDVTGLAELTNTYIRIGGLDNLRAVANRLVTMYGIASEPYTKAFTVNNIEPLAVSVRADYNMNRLILVQDCGSHGVVKTIIYDNGFCGWTCELAELLEEIVDSPDSYTDLTHELVVRDWGE